MTDTHINTLVSFALAHGIIAAGAEQATADELFRGNVRSVNYRYNERAKCTGFVFKPVADLPAPIVILKASHCYDYQSCERPDWEATKAYKLSQSITALARAQVGHPSVVEDRLLPGWDDAPWGLPDPTPAST
ncbi:hypothetical protein QTI66_32655 [Variovorax sp. J22R133]|uniref:hypothetical protein n=1 Tax=Variovorax brevis TaxID=3053503 RepID=UPI002574CCB8|nr:hypothetical protein [Variovorax sp. J22R133]MDM0116879.1 hypothetical protein [Variovorax sp. J22R133]